MKSISVNSLPKFNFEGKIVVYSQDNPPPEIKGTKPRGPGMIRKASNFSLALAAHKAAGSPIATDEQVAERFAICLSDKCGLFNQAVDKEGNAIEGKGQCLHKSCGCTLKNLNIEHQEGAKFSKLRWADQECPIGMWKALVPKEETNENS